MDRNSKILILVFIILILASVFLTYRRSFIEKDFTVFEEEMEGLEEITE